MHSTAPFSADEIPNSLQKLGILWKDDKSQRSIIHDLEVMTYQPVSIPQLASTPMFLQILGDIKYRCYTHTICKIDTPETAIQ